MKEETIKDILIKNKVAKVENDALIIKDVIPYQWVEKSMEEYAEQKAEDKEKLIVAEILSTLPSGMEKVKAYWKKRWHKLMT